MFVKFTVPRLQRGEHAILVTQELAWQSC
jgi:hypothetical protein